MDPTEWGPAMWLAIHSTAACYPVNPTVADRARYLAFYESLGWVLPCKSCAQSYRTFLASGDVALHPEDFTTRVKLFDWTVRLHNAINRKLGKPQFSARVAYDAYQIRV